MDKKTLIVISITAFILVGIMVYKRGFLEPNQDVLIKNVDCHFTLKKIDIE